MRHRIHGVLVSPEVGDFADEVRRIFLELGRTFGPESLAGECAPPLDVVETDEAVQIAVDLPGVEAAAVRVVIKGDGVLIAGEKLPRRGGLDSTFHLVERGFGRFARTIRTGRACDAARARATLVQGQLRVWIPKIPERRGRPIPIQVSG